MGIHIEVGLILIIDGNPDVRQQSDDKRDVTDILINGNWVELMIGVPM